VAMVEQGEVAVAAAIANRRCGDIQHAQVQATSQEQATGASIVLWLHAMQ
jgi:hypothetical protein